MTRFETNEELVGNVSSWLDVRYPDWYQKIDLESFNIVLECDCIGGQIGVDWVTLRDQWLLDHSISQEEYFSTPLAPFSDALLNDLYKAEIRKRLQEAQVGPCETIQSGALSPA